jgi:hypothetical protein
MDDRCDPLDDDEEDSLLPTASTGWSSKATSATSASSIAAADIDDTIDSPQVFRPAPAAGRLSASFDLFQTSLLQDYQAEFELCSVNTQTAVSLFDNPATTLDAGASASLGDSSLSCQLLGPTMMATASDRFAQMYSLNVLASALPAPRLHLLCYQLQAEGVVDASAVQRLVHNVLTSFPTDHLQVGRRGGDKLAGGS